MNNPSPLVTRGPRWEKKNRSRKRVRFAVFCVLALHVVPITIALLLQGCRKPDETQQTGPDTNGIAATLPLTNNPVVDTNTIVNNPIPAAVTTNPAPPVLVAGAAQEYTIARGDNFTTIGKKVGVPARAIQEANPGVDPLKIRPGQKIHI